jgi:hypothetical protein
MIENVKGSWFVVVGLQLRTKSLQTSNTKEKNQI